MARYPQIERGDFEATEANQYLRDNIEVAADRMVEVMELLGYGRLAL